MSEPVLRFETTLRAMVCGAALPGRQLVCMAFMASAFYGALMGTYSGFGGHLSLAQMLFSALKVPALLLITGALCLPAYFVANSLVGLADDWPQARRALILTQTILAIVLASLSPFTLLFYASTSHYQAAILFNFLMFAAASFTAQNVLRRLYAPLIEKDARHRILLRGCLALYGFTAVQFAYTLRPFVGDPTQPVEFFRSGAWDNAYVVIGKMIWNLMALAK